MISNVDSNPCDFVQALNERIVYASIDEKIIEMRCQFLRLSRGCVGVCAVITHVGI